MMAALIAGSVTRRPWLSWPGPDAGQDHRAGGGIHPGTSPIITRSCWAISSYPQMSDRVVGKTTGLAARTVAAIRRRSTDSAPQLNARVGRDAGFTR